MNINGWAQIALSSVVVYLFIIIAIRLFGKKELAQLSVVDLVFILLISNAVQNAMVGADSSLVGGLVAASALFIVNFTLKFILYRFPSLSRMVQGEPIFLVYNGKLNQSNMRRARISVLELEEAMREHGVLAINDINLAVLEVDGNISILSDDFRQKTSRKRKAHKAMTKQQ